MQKENPKITTPSQIMKSSRLIDRKAEESHEYKNLKNTSISPSKQKLSTLNSINKSNTFSQEKDCTPKKNANEICATNFAYESPRCDKENDVIQASPRVTPYWEVLKENGITSPPLTRSASKRKRQRAERLQDFFDDKENQVKGICLTYSPPNKKKNLEDERSREAKR